MNKKIIVGSIFVVFMLILLPTNSAVEVKNNINKDMTIKEIKELQNMDIKEFINFLVKLIEEYPELQNHISNEIEELEDKEIDKINFEEEDSNQTLLEKIWLKVFNYRLFRLYVIFWITVYTQSKITLIRTIHWAMKVLRWIKIGLILNIIELPDNQPPETPEITFAMDLENNTLTVVYVNPDNVLWSDLDQIGSGNCDPLPTGNVTVGDIITNCSGTIVIRYIPTNEVIGVFEFQ